MFLICHMLYTNINQVINIMIHIFSVCIAPFAIFFIKETIGFLADIRIFQRHTAALADKLSWRTEKRIDRYIKQF